MLSSQRLWPSSRRARVVFMAIAPVGGRGAGWASVDPVAHSTPAFVKRRSRIGAGVAGRASSRPCRTGRTTRPAPPGHLRQRGRRTRRALGSRWSIGAGALSVGTTSTYLPASAAIPGRGFHGPPVRRGHELAADGLDADRRARIRAGAPRLRAIGVERVEDVGPGDAEVRRARVASRLEAAHDPGVPASPYEQPDRAPVRDDRDRGEPHRLSERVRGDDAVRSAVVEVERGRPAEHARALADAAVGPRAAVCAGLDLQPALGLAASGPRRAPRC